MKNKNLSKLDTAQTLKQVIDCELDAVRVMHAHDIETSIELSAADGDSVITVPVNRKVESGSCSDLRFICVYVKNDSEVTAGGRVEVSPNDEGDFFVPFFGLNAEPAGFNSSPVMPICARRIRIFSDPGTSLVVIGQS